MMCRFDSFAVSLTQQWKSSEFMRRNAVFNVYRDNRAGPGGARRMRVPAGREAARLVA